MRVILERNRCKSHLTRGVVLALTAAALASVTRCQDTNLSSGPQSKAPMPEYIQEFFLSEAVRSQDKGEWQITLAADARQSAGANAAVQMEYGLTDRLQFSSTTPYGITTNQNAVIPVRWSSIAVGVVYQVMRSDRPFALAAGVTFSVPVRSQGALGYEPSILVARTFRRLQLHASLLSDLEHWKPTFEYNVACVYPLARLWFPTFEFNGRRLDGKNAFYLTPGLYRHWKHRLEMGIGIPLGVGGVAGSLGIVAKMNWEHGRRY